MSDSSPPYDLRNPEEMFHCIDILTRARASLSTGEPHLAEEIGKLTEALMELFNPDAMEIDKTLAPPSRPRPQSDPQQFQRPAARPAMPRQPLPPPGQGPPAPEADQRQYTRQQPLRTGAPMRQGSAAPPSPESQERPRQADRFADFDPVDLIGGPPVRRDRKFQAPPPTSHTNDDEIEDVLTGEKIRLR